MLETERVEKSFGSIKVIKEVGLYLKQGEAVGLLGPNGAGKSTLIDMLSSLSKPTKGQVLFNGKPVFSQLSSFRNRIGVVPQELALYMELTAEENLMFFGKAYQLKGAKLKQKVDQLLNQVELNDRRKDKVSTFSGGMKRRLNLAVALIHDPDYLILDEPTVGIDPHSRRYLLDLIKKLQVEDNKTVLYTSHYMEEVEFLCDRLYVLDRGSIIAAGTQEEIKHIVNQGSTYHLMVESSSQELELALTAHDKIERFIQQDDGYRIVSYSNDLFEDLIQLASEANVRVQGIRVQEPTLEDVFLHLTGRSLRD
ncbi:ABC-2 type transport system ATP-binding protein [Alkalihalobacillus xiaoxiensis]|uniref:ABC-2 type transport system ATP-binding protein n=1 Tax=Shouchella xiaoxiensis TaxID=766895 RepID=A0ABS2SVF0_9BACI|nr:ABC transporter ATP-binding protein [Shouchella xiaoxiensis]MBM7838991.1 ABC-2 type transport system ATP-binding protein [Shouchella xiaoxiensis]